MIFLTLIILALVALTLCWAGGEQGEKAMLAKLILCFALLYGLAMCWAAKMVLE